MKVKVLDPRLTVKAIDSQGQRILMTAGRVYDLDRSSARGLLEANLVTLVTEPLEEVKTDESQNA